MQVTKKESESDRKGGSETVRARAWWLASGKERVWEVFVMQYTDSTRSVIVHCS